MSPSPLARLSLCLASLGLTAALSGCGALQPGTDIGYAAPSGSGSISGSAYGGAQVITGATVTLYTSGSSGLPAMNTQNSFSYGINATPRAATTTSSTGAFSFIKGANTDASGTGSNNWGCPTTGDPLVYIVAEGGNPTGNGLATPNNSAIKLMAMLGKCSEVGAGTRVYLNEVTTVASVAAMQQFLNPNWTTTSGMTTSTFPSVGGSGSTQSLQATYDAAATITNLIDIRTGSARASSRQNDAGANTTGIKITVTPEIRKINTLANILAACVSSSSASDAACTTLMSNATAPTAIYTSQPTATFNAPTDTLTAIYYMMTNPTSGGATTNSGTKIANLFALQNSTPPFGPRMTSAPTDWTIGVRYDATGQVCGTSSTKFLGYSYHVSADASGNIWAAGATSTAPGLFQLGATGDPLACVLTGVGSGGSLGFTSTAVDPAGNVWTNSFGASNLYEYKTDGSVSIFPTASAPSYVIADGANNIYYSFNANLIKIPAVVAAAAPAGGIAGTKIGTISSTPLFLAVAGDGSIYSTFTTTGAAVLYQSAPVTSGGTGDVSTGQYLTGTSATGKYINNYGVAVGIDGKVWSGNGTLASSSVAQTWAAYTPAATPGGGTVTNTTQTFAGLGGAREVAIDGAGNIFAANSIISNGNYVSGATTNQYHISEISYDASALSATGTVTGTSSNGGFQKETTILPYAPRGVAITPAGNVWIGSNSGSSNGLTEYVGAAVPVVTPLATAQQLYSTNGGNIVPKP